jgi:IS1 family transposase
LWEKKQKHCDENDPADADFGDCWDFVVFDAESKLVVSLVLGARIAETAEQVFADFYFRTDGVPPRLITTDEFKAYESVIISTYDASDDEEPGPCLPEELCYATVCKRREKGRVVEVRKQTVLGTDEQLEATLADSCISSTVNTSYVERFNGTQRHRNARKARKTYAFSKDLYFHVALTWLGITIYNFCWEPRTLRVPISKRPPRYTYRTPAMAAGIAEQAWTVRKLLTYPIFPGYSQNHSADPPNAAPGGS